jgi:hypothetical protein
MGLKMTIIAVLVLLTSGCALTRGPSAGAADEEKVRSFAATYRLAKAARPDFMPAAPGFTLLADAGYDAPYFPVCVPGRVEKVWVPAHVADGDRDVMVAGHWTFIMLERPRWYVEAPAAPGERP